MRGRSTGSDGGEDMLMKDASGRNGRKEIDVGL
jgi:hypothetical protein